MAAPVAGQERPVRVAAMIAWIVTMTGGSVLALSYLGRGGRVDSIDAARASDVQAPGGDPGRDGPLITGSVIGTHALLAVLGFAVLVLWIANDGDPDWGHARWAVAIFVLAAAAFGVTMFLSWSRPEHRDTRTARSFPRPVVYIHGVTAAVTIALALAAAIVA